MDLDDDKHEEIQAINILTQSSKIVSVYIGANLMLLCQIQIIRSFSVYVYIQKLVLT